MTGQPWLVGQVVPEEFFRVFANYFWTKNIFDRQGSRNIRKIFLRVYKMFRLVMYIFECRHYAEKFKVVLGKLLDCKAQLLEINRAPTAR